MIDGNKLLAAFPSTLGGKSMCSFPFIKKKNFHGSILLIAGGCTVLLGGIIASVYVSVCGAGFAKSHLLPNSIIV